VGECSKSSVWIGSSPNDGGWGQGLGWVVKDSVCKEGMKTLPTTDLDQAVRQKNPVF